jgi:flagellar motor switch protein FliN/FliY
MSSSPTSSFSSDAAAQTGTVQARAAAPAAGPVAGAEPVFPGMMDVSFPVAVRLGSGAISVGDCLSLRPQSIIRLFQNVGTDLDMVVNGEVVARGEVAIVDDSTSIRLTDIAVTPGDGVTA